MIEIRPIDLPEQKSHICDCILRSLPNWFGNESAVADYAQKVQTMPLWAAFDADKPIGFVTLKVHNAYTAEVCVMGILKDYHRCGIGKALIAHCEDHCNDLNIEFLTVKTLDGSAESASYAKTRQFYEAMGFRPLEVFPLYWDEENPCLFLAKYIHREI